MAMRLEIDFDRPLDRDARLRLLIAVAGMAKTRRLRIASDCRRAWIAGEALSGERVARVLTEGDVHPRAVTSSLSREDEERVDDFSDHPPVGRGSWRPGGR